MAKRVLLNLCCLVAMWFVALSTHAEQGAALKQELTWYEFEQPYSTDQLYITSVVNDTPPKLIAQPRLTGGHYLSVVDITIPELDWYVIDFSGSTLVGQFRHQIIDSKGAVIAAFEGGVENSTPNPTMLRHSRSVILQPGDYQIFTQQTSQFNIATPTPFVMKQDQYLASIKLGNAITLVGLGIFCGLGILYLTLGLYRFRPTDLAYGIFIIGNLMFNGTTLLAFCDLLNIHWFRGASLPIAISNIAYIVFVMRLLDIDKVHTPKLMQLGHTIIGFYVVVFAAGFILSHYQNEMNRIGVAIFFSYGLLCGLTQLKRGLPIAKYYVLANIGFVLLGSIAISQNGIEGQPTLYMSHIGLMAVAVEVVLLSMVLAYQMHLVGREKAFALKEAELSLALAQTDELTQIENRRAMDVALKKVSYDMAFIYLDLDGLKQCNDQKGHAFGDEVLKAFAQSLSKRTNTNQGRLFRIGGDEFGLLFSAKHRTAVKQAIAETEAALQKSHYANFGISLGMAFRAEHSSAFRMVEAADQRMYKNKTTRRVVRDSLKAPSAEFSDKAQSDSIAG